MSHHYNIYTGPTVVQRVADKLRSSDSVLVTLEGTMHVYVIADTPQAILDALIPIEGWKLSDVRPMPWLDVAEVAK